MYDRHPVTRIINKLPYYCFSYQIAIQRKILSNDVSFNGKKLPMQHVVRRRPVILTVCKITARV